MKFLLLNTMAAFCFYETYVKTRLFLRKRQIDHQKYDVKASKFHENQLITVDVALPDTFK